VAQLDEQGHYSVLRGVTRADGLPVEEEKPLAEQGFYLRPEASGQPREKGIEWARHSEQMRTLGGTHRERPEPSSTVVVGSGRSLRWGQYLGGELRQQ
jgi:hypothetical protein